MEEEKGGGRRRGRDYIEDQIKSKYVRNWFSMPSPPDTVLSGHSKKKT